MTTAALEQQSIDTIRFLSIDMVQKANSGHPGLPLGAAPMAYTLWTNFLRFNPSEPGWPNRDRFVLSAGHGSALLYSMLHLYGYDLPIKELKNFRQLHSKTPGHPESVLTAGVEVTTGPLGQGFGNGVGMAIAESFLSARYNREGFKLFDHYTYALVSDGDLMEGIASEAASLAGHLKLGKLIYLYDNNHISLDGPTSLAFTEDVCARFRAYGWHTRELQNGNDTAAIAAAIREAQSEEDKPSLISVKTIIGYGSPLAGTSKAHGSPLGEDNVKKTKEQAGWDPGKTFFIPPEVAAYLQEAGQRGVQAQEDWKILFDAYCKLYPAEGKELKQAFAAELPEGWEKDLPIFKTGDQLATRQASGKVLEKLKERIPWMLGGSADLASSNDMPVKGELSYQPGKETDSNIWFGVREHAMGAILNGMSASGLRAYGGTFLNFSDYMRGAMRLAALSELPVVYVFTHDSIGLGEDGPTHQPVEQISSLRAMPNIKVFRPGDANETVQAWKCALESTKGPTALILTRQKLPVLDRTKYAAAENSRQGGYTLSDSEKEPDLILIASGSELSLALAAQDQLKTERIHARVVSMPCQELFNMQEDGYRNEVLPPGIKKRIAIEAAASLSWYRYTGLEGAVIGLDRFGLSAPGEEVMQAFGFTAEHVCEVARQLMQEK
jgi:transketolase